MTALNQVCLPKGDERYVLLFDDAHKADALRVLGRWASHPGLSFTWYDAALLSQTIRDLGKTYRGVRMDLEQGECQ